MRTNLLSNKELEDYKTGDSFNFLVKADAIRIFLEHNSTLLEKNKMLVLYGDWGSGKTSLMKHIESEINRDIYYPIFFHAWEHEKDENLSLSLCDALISSLGSGNEIIKDFMKGAFLTLKSFTSGVTFKAPAFLSGLGLDFEFSGEKYINALDKAFEDSGTKSFYKSNKEFKESFKKVEQLILDKSGAQKILIFVDDLDRCEPENVLNLITALKLFFTYGEKTIFLTGIDKDAVTKAVKTRYRDVVKSEEYMEKVFDIAFNMPKTFSLRKMLEPHFFDSKTTLSNGLLFNSIDIIEDFFRSIQFTNPRHLKKVLNKYEILKGFKILSTIPKEFRDLVPNILIENEEGSVFETIYCLFFIILYEFYPYEFEDMEDYKQKMIRYADIVFTTRSRTAGTTYSKEQAFSEVNTQLLIRGIETMTFDHIVNLPKQGAVLYGRSKFLFIFSNSKPANLGYIRDGELNKYSEYFTDNEINTNFCKFLIKHIDALTKETIDSEYIIWNLFGMVKYLL